MKALRIDRRMYLTGAGALLASTGAFAQETKSMNAVSNRAHILIHPSLKDRSIWCFSSILGCGAPISLSAPGKPEPILAFRFPGGGSVSIEFTEQALDEAEARRGAWLELKSENPAELKKKVIEAGLPQVQYWATKVFYFVVPGGQVFGIFQPEEMR